MFIKTGDAQILEVVDEKELTEEQKKKIKEEKAKKEKNK